MHVFLHASKRMNILYLFFRGGLVCDINFVIPCPFFSPFIATMEGCDSVYTYIWFHIKIRIKSCAILVNCTTQQLGLFHFLGNLVLVYRGTPHMFYVLSTQIDSVHMVLMAMVIIGFQGPVHIMWQSYSFLIWPLQFTSVYMLYSISHVILYRR